MFSRFAQTARASARTAGRRYSTAHSTSIVQPKSDLAWFIGSAVVFGPTIFYLTSPRSTAHPHAHATTDPYPKAASAPAKADEPEEAEAEEPEEEPREITPKHDEGIEKNPEGKLNAPVAKEEKTGKPKNVHNVAVAATKNYEGQAEEEKKSEEE